MTAPHPLADWAAPGKHVFDFWISFFPAAPLFGVEWRFAGMLSPAASPMTLPGAALFDTPSAWAFPAPRGAAPEPSEPESAGEESGAEVVDAGVDDAPLSEASAEAVDLFGNGVAAREATGVRAEADAAPAEAEETTEETAADPGLFPTESAEADTDTSEPTLLLLSSRPDDADDLKALKGVGPGLERQLNELGVWKFGQIARMTDADLAWVEANLTTIKGRCFRDDWIGQAKQLVG